MAPPPLPPPMIYLLHHFYLLQKVNLTFAPFSVEAGPNCTYDSVAVFDGAGRNARLIGRYCNNFRPGTIISTGRNLFVVFTTDPSYQKAGFQVGLVGILYELRLEWIADTLPDCLWKYDENTIGVLTKLQWCRKRGDGVMPPPQWKCRGQECAPPCNIKVVDLLILGTIYGFCAHTNSNRPPPPPTKESLYASELYYRKLS